MLRIIVTEFSAFVLGLSFIDPADPQKGGIILNNSYEVQHTVNLRGDLKKTNMHDFTLVDEGKHVVTLTHLHGKASVEESAAVGFDGECNALWEGFRELDAQTSETIFDWSPHDHIGLDEVTRRPKTYEEMCTKSVLSCTVLFDALPRPPSVLQKG